MNLVEWLSKAIADPKLRPLRKLLQRPDLPANVRASVEAYIEADEELRSFHAWQHANSHTVSATRECGDMPIMAMSHPDYWKEGSRERQYGELAEIVESIGCPLKQELTAKSFEDKEISVQMLFGLKLTGDGEVFDITAATSRLDYDPVEQRRKADEYNAKHGPFDRLLWWDHVFTLCGRVHGFFDEREDWHFAYRWKEKHGSEPPKTPSLLLERITVTLTGAPSERPYPRT